MLIDFFAGAAASTDCVTQSFSGPTPPDSGVGRSSSGGASPSPQPENVRHLVFGTLIAVRSTIKQLHKLGYAEPNDWSKPIATDRHNEVMVVLTKRMNVL